MRSTTPLLIAVALCTGCAVPPTTKPKVRQPISIAPGVKTQLIHLQAVQTRISLGEEVARIQYGWACLPGSKVGWQGGRIGLTDEQFAEAFQAELEKRNFRVTKPPTSVFEPKPDVVSDLRVGGTITSLQANICYPFSGSPTASVGSTNTIKGSVFLQISWEIYSRSKGAVLFRVVTDGAFRTDDSIVGGIPAMLSRAFTASVANLLAENEFVRLATAPVD